MGNVIDAEKFFTKLLERKIKSGAKEALVPKSYFSYDAAIAIAMRFTAGLIVQKDAYLFTKYKSTTPRSRSARKPRENRTNPIGPTPDSDCCSN